MTAAEVERILEPTLPPPHFELTDIGNAERLVYYHGGDMRYDHAAGKWRVWDGRRWALDETGRIDRLAKATLRAMKLEASRLADKRGAEALWKHANASESNGRIKAMIERAAKEPGITILPDELDRDPLLLNVPNGTVDLRSGQLKPHRRQDYITRMAGAAYDPSAQCERFRAFLRRIFDDDENKIGFIHRMAGYSLTGDTSEQCFALCYGTGANGKSTLLELMSRALGDYAHAADFSTFLERDDHGARNDLAAMRGARLVTASETGQGRRLDESVIKALTGRDRIRCRYLYSESFEYTPSFKVWLAANHKPRIVGTDDGIWRRVRLVPFDVRIPESDQNPKLLDELTERELPAILAWMVRGCLEWQRDGLRTPDEVRNATDAYRAESDALLAFLEACCELNPKYSEFATPLYRQYRRWAEAAGELAMSQRLFGTRLAEKGFMSVRHTASGLAMWQGLRLTEGSEGSEGFSG